jgi:replicative DNA helicase
VKQLEPTTGLLFSLAVIENKGPLSFLSSFRLSKEFFIKEEQIILDIMSKHVELYKELPTKSLIEIETGYTLPVLPIENNVQFWADEVRKRYAVENSFSLCKEAMSKISEGDIDSAANIATKLTRILVEGQTKTKVYSLEDTIDTLLDLHNKARLNIREFGVPFGLGFLDSRSGGAQGGDLICLAGLPSSGKTFMLMHMALSAHAQGSSILFIPTEMSEVQYHRRAIALRNNINVNKIKFGGLTTTIGEEVIKYDKQLLSEMPNKFYMTDASMSLGVLDVKSAAYVYKPDAIYVDGAYLLRPEFYAKTRYEIVSSVAESLKTLAKEMNIPIFATYQLNKRSEDIYQSAVVRQLASIVIEMSDCDNEIIGAGQWDNTRKPKLLNITKGRDGEEGNTIIIIDTYHTRITEAVDDRTLNSNEDHIALQPVDW